MIYVIEKLWWDPMENHNSHGYSVHSYVKTEEEAKVICEEAVHYTKSKYPLAYIKDEDRFVKLYRYELLEEFKEVK